MSSTNSSNATSSARPRPTHAIRVKWTNESTRALIDERKNRNQVNTLFIMYIYNMYKLLFK